MPQLPLTIARKNRFPLRQQLLLLVTAVLFGSIAIGQTVEPPKGDGEVASSVPKENAISAAEREFFEAKIRPVLVERCYECHNTAETAEADLALDWRDGTRAETEHGTVVDPGKPDSSLLLQVIRHELPDLEMPEGGPKLDDSVVEDFRKWIAMGAPDPRTSPPSAAELSEATSWEKTLEKRKQWWSLQPLQNAWPPSGTTGEHPIDQFIRAELARQQLQQTQPADRRTLIRRLSFALTGLPPTPAAINEFVNDDSENAFEKLVDRYLDSEHFGERWARHWMDLIRYTDSHGSEGDPMIPHAWQYRDYLIRALNSDVPYDQLVREHLAGDLLRDPRVNKELGINESAIGPAHFRFVFHGFAPTDALDERVRFTDDQVNVVSKAFLGMTVSCARCHDHKFDAISQTDYYAMAGIFGSCRPALRDINLPEKKTAHIDRVEALKDQLRGELADDWLASLDALRKKLLQPDEDFQAQVEQSKDAEQMLNFWGRLTSTRKEDTSLQQAWNAARDEWQQQRSLEDQPDNVRNWNLTETGDYKDWFAWGNGMPDAPTAAGEFTIREEGSVVQGIFPEGVLSHRTSQKHAGFLGSKRILLDEEYDAWLLVAGEGQPSVRYVVENYPRNGTVYPIPTINNRHFRWQRLNLKYWTGDNVHFELATSKDAPLQNRNRDRSWFAVRDVVIRKSGEPAPANVSLEYLTPLFSKHESAPKDEAELADRVLEALRQAIVDWRDNKLSDQQARLIDGSLALLPNEVDTLPVAAETVKKIRELQSTIPEPTRVPGIVEADAFDQPLYVRGNHRQPADPVKRRFLEAIDAEPYEPTNSGRLELAESILDPDNPLTSRVIANRIWHYLFGQGIVSTPDNLGQLGAKPSHPVLLDYLSRRMMKNGWSIKDMIRFIVTSETWQLADSPSDAALEKDPENRFLSHANVLRLDAESIRDGLLAVSGQLNEQMYGPGFRANGEETRRSVYITSRRNSLDEFLKTFDSPTPFSTTGRRDITNVPSQSLTMMNDPFINQLARRWADSVQGDPGARISTMIATALGRAASNAEVDAFLAYVESLKKQFAEAEEQRAELDGRIIATQDAIAAIVEPARQRLQREQEKPKADSGKPNEEALTPIAAWEFDGPEDSVGELNVELKGDAKIENGALVLNGGYAHTGRLQQDLEEKTLVANVQLATLDQAGGGVITVQTRDGVFFDSIVFAERRPHEWMSGSNGFVRTDDLDGPQEATAHSSPVHVAATYSKDGTIRFYRNGQRYGKVTRKGELQSYRGKRSQILFGLRHGEVNDDDNGRRLLGSIVSAQLYDRVLSDEEVAATANGENFISDQQLVESLSGDIQQELASLRAALAELEAKRLSMPEPQNEDDAWARLAHAIFNLKEFIYVR